MILMTMKSSYKLEARNIELDTQPGVGGSVRYQEVERKAQIHGKFQLFGQQDFR